MPADVSLLVNGRAYGGWMTARVTRGIECLAGTFELSVSDRWANQQKPWPIYEEDECVLKIGETTVISGYVDKRSISFSATDHSLSVSGRDKAGMLVDCSAVLKSWEFKHTPLLQLAQALAAPFGVSVRMAPGLSAVISAATGKSTGQVSSGGGSGKQSSTGVPKPPAKFTIDPGESAFDVLDRACRIAAVLPVSDGAGGILLTRAGSRRADTALVEGENILSASADYDMTNRYSRYVIAAQHQGTDWLNGPAAAGVKGEAEDATVRRSARILYLRPDSGMTREIARNRARWEAMVRAARGVSVSVTVQGWKQPNGALWPVNALVPVRSPTLGINLQMLITQAVHSLDENGELTQLTLRRPDAFIPEPTVQNPSLGKPSQLWPEIKNGVQAP